MRMAEAMRREDNGNMANNVTVQYKSVFVWCGLSTYYTNGRFLMGTCYSCPHKKVLDI